MYKQKNEIDFITKNTQNIIQDVLVLNCIHMSDHRARVNVDVKANRNKLLFNQRFRTIEITQLEKKNKIKTHSTKTKKI